MRIFQTLYFSALTVMTLVPSAKADRAQELVEQFCHAHAEICEQFADQKPLLETYLVGYEFEASHALEKSQIPPAFQDVDPLDIAPLLKNVFRIARTAPHPKENTIHARTTHTTRHHTYSYSYSYISAHNIITHHTMNTIHLHTTTPHHTRTHATHYYSNNNSINDTCFSLI